MIHLIASDKLILILFFFENTTSCCNDLNMGIMRQQWMLQEIGCNILTL
jgi:hypothetical protein